MMPIGSHLSEFAIILEQPNKYEAGVGKPLTGHNTKLFVETLNLKGLLHDTYCTFAIKSCQSEISTFVHRGKDKTINISAEGIKYRDQLFAELERMRNVKVILACGNVPLYFLAGLYGIYDWRGSMLNVKLPSGRSVVVVPSLTPWHIQFDQAWKIPFMYDLDKVQQILNGTYTKTIRDIIIRPTMAETLEFLSMCTTRGLLGERISYDIEVNNYHDKERAAGLVPEVSMISFATRDLRAICIPFTSENGDYFPAEQELEIWVEIAKLLSNGRIAKIGQYVQFDAHFLLHTYGIRCNNMHCTAIAQHTISSELPKGLDFITSIWTDHPYYKNDGKALFAGDVNDRGYKYNATDSVICSEAFEKQLDALISMDNSETYERQRMLIEPLTYMMEHGLKVDVALMQKMFIDYGELIDQKQEELNTLCGRVINPRSTQDVHSYFNGVLHLAPYKKRNTKGVMAPTYDDTAMKRYIRQGYKEATLIQEIKRLGKWRAGYLDLTKVDKDGRYRCFYDPTGTAFSRLASKENIFGTGSNLQNWPKVLRQVFMIDEGYIGYSIDLSQAENRLVAYEGRVIPMIEAFESGKDVHTLTTRLLLVVIYGALAAESMDVESMSPLGSGDHTWRDWGKKANHGFNYDWGYKAFSLKNELPETQGKLVYDGYHKAYPEIKTRYHAGIREAIRRTRTITNLKGRHTLFLGELSDELYKAGYSCLPQGTVGDIINEHGLGYIWYASDFDDVELLTQTHDEIVFQIPIALGLDQHAKLIGMIVKSLECVLRTSWGKEFVIPCDLTMLSRLYAKDYGAKIKADLKDTQKLTPALEEAYAQLWPKKENSLTC